MASKTKTYGIIERGTSLTIPVLIKDSSDEPMNLAELTVYFTMKAASYDYDMRDDRAFIAKDFAPQ